MKHGFALNTLITFLALLGVCAPQAFAASAPVAAQMMPIRSWRPLPDARGGQWYIQPDGSLNCGLNGNMERTLDLSLGGGISWGTPLQSADGSVRQFTAQSGNLTVVRTYTFYPQQAAMQVVDSFTNKGNAPVSCKPMLMFNINGRLLQLITDRGRPAQGALNKKECGIVIGRDPNYGGGDSIVVFGSPGTSCKPVINNMNNSGLNVQWDITIKPGTTVALVTTMALRPGASTQPVKNLEKDFKDFSSRQWIANLTKEQQKSLLNIGSASLFGDGPSLELLEGLGLSASDADQLAIGSGTILKGTASCAELTIQTAYGTTKIPTEQLAALAGPAFTGGPLWAYLRDGQVVAGTAEARDLLFVTRTGIHLPLKAETLDRIRFHAQPDDGKPSAKAGFYLQMFDGSRLALSCPPDTPLPLLSTWGPRTIAFGEILRLEALSGDAIGYRIATRDGSAYFCYLNPGEFAVDTVLFGNQRILPARIRALTAAQAPQAAEEEAKERPQTPHIRLIGDSILSGTIDLTALKLLSQGNALAVPPNQIRSLINENAENEEDSTPIFAGELWGSGAVRGEAADLLLPLRTADGILQVPARDIVEIAVPTPMIPDSVRQRIGELIRNLGSDQWNARDKASAELRELGVMARQQLQEQLSQTADEEVRWRIQKLLDAIGD